jgi:Chaperone of endosialidase
MKNLLFICSLLLIFFSGKAQNFTIFDNATTTTQTATGLSYSRTGSTGINNVAIGSNSLRNNTTGTNSTAIGTNALFNQQEGARNTAIGVDALKNMKGAWTYQSFTAARGLDNVAIGYKAMAGRVDANTGALIPIYANNNIAIGNSALEEIEGIPTFTGGSYDSRSSANGINNIAIGAYALKKTQNGSGNIGIGSSALENTNGYHTITNSPQSLGRNNIGLGTQALYTNTTGSNNIAIGNFSGFSSNFADSDKLYIGGGTTPLIGGDLSAGKVGINKTIASIIASTAKLQVGGDIACVNISFSSDVRYKKNIQAIEGALDKVTKMNGVTYDWKISEYPEMNFIDKKQIGFIAQEVEKVLPELVITDSKGYKSVDYVKVIPILLEAIKELNKDRDTLKKDIIAIQNTLKALIDRAN